MNPTQNSPLQPLDDIRDIRGPIPIAGSSEWIYYVVGALVLAALAYAAWRWWKSRVLPTPPPDPLTAALAALEKTRELLNPATAREFSIEVSQIVRLYIHERFQIKASQQTTEEFLRDLVNQPNSPLTTHRPLLADFLEHCDRAKFGRYALTVAEMESLLQSAQSFLRDSQPKPEPVAP